MITRDITFSARDVEHGAAYRRAAPGHRRRRGAAGFRPHVPLAPGRQDRGQPEMPVQTRDDLSMVYTPGVARICRAIHADPDAAFALTIRRNSVAVVTDGIGRAGAGQHRPPGRAAGDGGQGGACSRSSPASMPSRSASTPKTPTRSSTPVARLGADLRRDQPGGHFLAAVRGDRGAAERAGSTFPSSTTTSTARRSSCWPPCRTP